MSDIIAVVPEYHAGPGWANQTILVIRNRGGSLSQEWIQPSEMTKEMWTLFRVCAGAHAAMLEAVEQKLHKEPPHE